MATIPIRKRASIEAIQSYNEISSDVVNEIINNVSNIIDEVPLSVSVVTTTIHTVTADEEVILVDASGSPIPDVTLTLHEASTARFRPLIIRPINGNVTLQGVGSPKEKVNGQETLAISEPTTLVNDPTNSAWWTV